MNRSIAKLYVVVLLLFALLVVWTSRWTVFSASALNDNALNRLSFFATEKVKRGRILADDGTTVLAKSVAAGGGVYTRSYPYGSLFAQVVGYNNLQQGQATGLEQSWVKQLEDRQETTLSSVFGPISTSNVGNDVLSTLDVKGQELARSLLDGRTGSVVAIVPQTGAIPVMYSNPSYDDNTPLATCPANPLGYGCQTNIATQGYFPPGSTFKVVTSTAALNTGRYTPSSTIDGKSPLVVSGVALENDGDTSYGDVTLTDALTYSINTVFAQVGLALGRSTMQDYMEGFGFYRTPQLGIAATASGERIYSAHGSPKLVPVTNTNIDLGRTAIGQANLTVTPFQMAEVAATVADGGTLMTPHFVTKAVNQYGQVVQTVAPSVESQVMKPAVAKELTQMMTDVVEEGTGTAANLDGLNAAGKTGTATIISAGADSVDDAWFIGFAPVNHPKIAVAVLLPHIVNGYGGTYAAPVAAQMMKTLLAEGL